jgi:hypothetical protein
MAGEEARDQVADLAVVFNDKAMRYSLHGPRLTC